MAFDDPGLPARHRPRRRREGQGEVVPGGDERPARLLDGTLVVTRPVRPSDAAPVKHLFAGMSETSLRRRFFLPGHLVSDVEAVAMVDIDCDRRQAFVVEAYGSILGFAQLAALGSGRRGEVALAVADEWQGKGIGTLLLERVTEEARHRGMSMLEADVLPENREMLEVFEHSMGSPAETFDVGVVHVSARLPGAGEPAPRAPGVEDRPDDA
jgi:GNAT superfamily N-acetyltransferase